MFSILSRHSYIFVLTCYRNRTCRVRPFLCLCICCAFRGRNLGSCRDATKTSSEPEFEQVEVERLSHLQTFTFLPSDHHLAYSVSTCVETRSRPCKEDGKTTDDWSRSSRSQIHFGRQSPLSNVLCLLPLEVCSNVQIVCVSARKRKVCDMT